MATEAIRGKSKQVRTVGIARDVKAVASFVSTGDYMVTAFEDTLRIFPIHFDQKKSVGALP